MRRILAVAALLIVGAAAYRVGYPWVSPLTIVTTAPQALSEQGSVMIKFDMLIKSLGGQTAGSEFSVKLRGDGAYDFNKNQGRMAIRGLPSSTTAPSVGNEAIFSGSDLYLRVASCPTGALGGKEWIKLNLSALPGVNPSSPTTSDPRSTLDGLRAAGEVTEVGREEINGVKTTRYVVKVDLDKAIEKLPTDQQTRVRATYQNLQSSGLRTEAWIRDDGLPARFRLSFEVSSPPAGRVSSVMTQDFFDYGKPVKIELPPEEEVYAVAGGQAYLSVTLAQCYPTRSQQTPTYSGTPPAFPQPSPS